MIELERAGSHRRLTVMHVVYSLGIGGAEKLAYDMAVALPREQYRPVVACIGDDGPLGQLFQEQGIPLYHRCNLPAEKREIVWWLKKVIEAEQVCVIHAHQYNPLYYSVLAALRNRRVNLVYTEHGRMYPEQFNWKRYFTNPLFALRIDHLVSISESTKGAMARYDNFPARRIEVIHNGIDFGRLNPGVDPAQMRRSLGIPETSRVIGTASRLEEIKNIPMMLKAMPRVLESVPDTVLVIAGQGSQGEQLKTMASELGVAGQVRFLGLRTDLPELFRIMEVFLLVSFTEGISITLLEAIGSGVPAVVTRTGGNPEVVEDGVCGRLIEVGDEAALSARVIELLGDPAEAARLGSAGRDRVRSGFTFQNMMQSYQALYAGCR